MFKSRQIVFRLLSIIHLLIVLSTVLVVDHDLINPTITGKYFWFYFSMAMLSGPAILLLWKYKRRITISAIDMVVLLFIIYNCILYGYLFDGIGLKFILFVLVGVLYFYFRIVFASRSIRRWAGVLFVITGLIEATWGLGQLYGLLSSFHESFKITGSFYNPGPYSGYLAVVFPFALYYLLQDFSVVLTKRNRKFIFFYFRWFVSLLTLSLIFVILPAGMSRASWLSALGGSLFVCIFYFKNNRKDFWESIKRNISKTNIRLSIFVFSSFIILASLIVSIYFFKKDSADGRILIWRNSIKIIVENPLGIGIGNFPGYNGEAQIDYFSSGQSSEREQFLADRSDYAFNEFFQITAEMGFLGLFLFLLIVVQGLYYGVRNKKYAIVGGLISILVFASLSYPFSVLPFLIVFVFLLSQCNEYKVVKYSVGRTWDFRLILCTCLLFVAFALNNRYPTYKAYNDWFIANHLYNSKAYEKSREIYESIYPYLFDQPGFLFDYAGCLTMLKEYEQSNELLDKAYNYCSDPAIYIRKGTNFQLQKRIDEAIECYMKATYLVPNRQYPYYLLAKLYFEIGDFSNAKKMAEYCLNKQPKVDSPAVAEMKEEMLELLNYLEYE